MDFLKSLMLYMSLTFAGSMQAAPTPEVTPVPTTPPAVVETIAPTEDPMAAVTAVLPTVEVTQAPTLPPQPTITPNTGYRNVKQGQRGDDVKKLQLRLIELGYLEEGSADGAFGNQTRRAVIAFQEANGLGADGVAGDATQTHLYENPDVKYNPAKPTPTPEPTATPDPTATPEVTATPDVTATPEATIAPPAEVPAETAAPAPALPDQPVLPVAEADLEREWLWNASIVYNDGGAPLAALRQEDGVTVTSSPRVYRLSDGRLQLSLSDLAAAIEGWDVTVDGNLISLNASGYVVTVMRISGMYSCMVDGQSLALTPGDVAITEGDPCVTTDFLQKALGAETIWDAEENALIMRVQPKNLAQAAD